MPVRTVAFGTLVVLAILASKCLTDSANLDDGLRPIADSGNSDEPDANWVTDGGGRMELLPLNDAGRASLPITISDQRTVAGKTNFSIFPFLWTPAHGITVIGFPGGFELRAVNASKQAVGRRYPDGAAIIWTDQTMRELFTDAGSNWDPLDISDDGWIVGRHTTGRSGFVCTPNNSCSISLETTLPSGENKSLIPSAVTMRGKYVGIVDMGIGGVRAFTSESDGGITVLTVPNATASFATDISADGVVVGAARFSEYQACLWREGTAEILPLPQDCHASEARQAVSGARVFGVATCVDGTRYVEWRDGGVFSVALPEVDDAGTLVGITSTNSLGDYVGVVLVLSPDGGLHEQGFVYFSN